MRIPLTEIKTIDQVVNALDYIITKTANEHNILGVFAYIYKRTTAEIKASIEKSKFQDNARMELFDVLFAKYYISAYYDYEDGKPVSTSWKAAFDARPDSLTIAQHIMLGMNAHINLDLGVTAAKIMEGKNIHEMEADFTLISNILAELVNEMQSRLNRVSRFMFLLDWIGQNKDKLFISFSIAKAREQSWRLAKTIWQTAPGQQSQVIGFADNNVAFLANIIKFQKSWLVRNVLKFIRKFEDTDPAIIIQKLSK